MWCYNPLNVELLLVCKTLCLSLPSACVRVCTAVLSDVLFSDRFSLLLQRFHIFRSVFCYTKIDLSNELQIQDNSLLFFILGPANFLRRLKGSNFDISNGCNSETIH